MTVDASIPLGIKTPDFMGNLNNVVGAAQGMQNLQTGLMRQKQLGQTIESGDIALQVQRQANAERKIWNQVMSDPQSMNPDGTINRGYVSTKAQQMGVVQTLPEALQGIDQANQQKIATNKAYLGLKVDQKTAFNNQVAATLSAGGNSSDVVEAIDNAVKDYGPELKPLADEVLDHVKMIETGPYANKKETIQNYLLGFTRRTANLDQLQASGSQEYPSFTTGLEQYFYGRKPLVPGQPQGSPAAPTAVAGVGVPPSIAPNALGVPTVVPGVAGAAPHAMGETAQTQAPVAPAVPAAQAKPSGTAAKPASNIVTPPGLPAFPDKPTVDALQQYRTKWQAAQAANADPTTGYQNTMQIYRNLNQVLKSDPKLGPGAPGWNSITGLLSPFGANTNSKYQEVSAYLDSLAQARAANVGATTNMGREQAAGAVGSPTYVHDALQEKLRFGAAVSEASNAYTTAASAFHAKYGNAGAAYGQQFDSAWTKNADALAFRLMASHNIGDDEDYQKTLAQAKKNPQVLQHYKNLKILMQGDIPK